MSKLAILLLVAIAAPGAEPITRPASNTDPGGKVGKRPYEMVWAKRKPAYPELVDFEDLTGWTVAGLRGCTAELFRSREEQMFGTYTGKVVYRGKTAASGFELRPPKPISIPGEPTAVQMWVRGNNWGWHARPKTARTHVHLMVGDAQDEHFAIYLGQVNFDYWFLMHATFVSPTGELTGRIRQDGGEGRRNGRLDYPLRCFGIRVTGCADERPAKLFFDALQCYEAEYPPLAEPKLPPKAPWPTTPETITPTPTEKVRNAKTREGPNHVFTAQGRRDTIRWIYLPRTGTLDDLTVEINGRRFQPCAGGGPVFELGGVRHRASGEGFEIRPHSLEWSADELRARWIAVWPNEEVHFDYRFRAKGKSLQISVAADSGAVVEFRIGRAVFDRVAQAPSPVPAKGDPPAQPGAAVPQAELIRVPYLTFGHVGPHIVHWDGIFLSALLDWYNSDASTLYEEHRRLAPDQLVYNGGSRYLPKTDGRRNDLRERLIVTVATDFHEVLPNIPHPRSQHAHLAKGAIWRNIGSPNHDLLKRLKAGGVERFICPLHEVGWRDAGESFTFRLRCAPRIGDEKMKEYGEWVKSLGYRFGLYANYTDYAPVNENWREDRVCLDSDGNWRGAWPRCYAPKPTWAWQAEAELAPKIAAKFGAVTCYSDVHTAVTPWNRTDYDARTPGAGMFRTTWECYARVLWNESRSYGGPVFSEGRMHWMYAGLIDGNYAQITGPDRWRVPPLVDFDLLKMHPLQCDFGMGMPSMFYPRRGGEWRRDRSRTSPYFDRFITSTLAFGHIGFLPLEWGFDGALKAFYMTNAVQQLYALVPVEAIRYFDGKKLLTTSEAIRTGAYKRGQVYVRYKSELELWCNLSFEHDWRVTCKEGTFLLPPTGHLAIHDGLVQFSALVDGRRVDYVINHAAERYVYLDTRGAFASVDLLSARGAVALKPADERREMWMIPAPTCQDVTLRHVGRLSGRSRARAYDTDGRELGEAEVRLSNMGSTILPVKGACRYRVEPVAPAPAPPCDERVRRLVGGLRYEINETVRGFAGKDLNVGSVQVERVGPDGKVLETKSFAGLADPIRVHVPADAKHDERLWWRLRIRGKVGEKEEQRVRWFTGLASRAIDVELKRAADTPQKPATPQQFLLRMKSNLPQPVEVDVVGKAKGIALAPSAEDLKLFRQKEQPLTMSFRLPTAPAVVKHLLHYVLPTEPTVVPMTLTFTFPQGKQTVERWLRVTKRAATMLDLTKVEPSDRGIAYRGKAEQPLTADSGACFYAANRTVGGVEKAGFFCHPPYKGGVGYAFAEFRVTLPDEPCAFETLVGFVDGSSTTDGCVFSVQLREPPAGSKPAGGYLTLSQLQFAELKKWQPFRADLSKFRGKKVTLRLTTDVGPADDSNSDWAFWGEPRIVLAGDRLLPEIFTEKPELPIGPPLIPLKGLKASDLRNIAEAKVLLDGAGVDGGNYRSDVYLNEIFIGYTPGSRADTSWTEKQALPVPPRALKTIGPRNVVRIRNPRHDWMKVRRVHLWFLLRDGRVGTSVVINGPFATPPEWPYAEG